MMIAFDQNDQALLQQGPQSRIEESLSPLSYTAQNSPISHTGDPKILVSFKTSQREQHTW